MILFTSLGIMAVIIFGEFMITALVTMALDKEDGTIGKAILFTVNFVILMFILQYLDSSEGMRLLYDY